MRRWIVGLLVVRLAVVAACARAAQVAPAPPEPTPARPRLVVLLVIDQLPSWAFERDRALFTGGLARLLREGATVPAATLPHANSFTAPGHATIGTGAPPNVHGVIGNHWYRRAEGRDLPAEHDPDAPVFSLVAGSAPVNETASSRSLRVDGLADVLRTASGGRAKSVAIALKARAACLIAGRRPDLAIWYEADAGGMTTSQAYASSPPAWLRELARTHPASRFVGRSWQPLDAAMLARVTGVADDRPGEGDVHGLGVAFPHRIADPGAILQTPFGDEVVLDAVHAALDALELGADEVPDLLALSLNAHDYAGHTWGPDSWESLDLTLRLDAALGTLFDELDRRLGHEGWAIVLTSDHGVTPLAEASPVAGARRISIAEIEAAAETVLVKQLGPGPWVAGVMASQLYLRARWVEIPTAARERALVAAAAAIATIPGVSSVHRVDVVRGGCAERTGIEQAVCHALAPEASGELFLVAARGSTITSYTTGTHHDAPNDDNRLVPIIVRAPGLAPQYGTGSMLQVAPTVAALLGIPAPPDATATPLFGLRTPQVRRAESSTAR